jgi:hypothetical protein
MKTHCPVDLLEQVLIGIGQRAITASFFGCIPGPFENARQFGGCGVVTFLKGLERKLSEGPDTDPFWGCPPRRPGWELCLGQN